MDNFDLKKYLVENKVTTNSKMLNETEPEDYLINSAASSFPQLIKKYGLEAVKTAFDVIYEKSPWIARALQSLFYAWFF